MPALPGTNAHLEDRDRRSFLWSIAAFGLTPRVAKPEQRSETAFRFLTPVCEVQMSVQHFASTSMHGLRFRDESTNSGFCLSASGEQNGGCLERFAGSMAIVHYRFGSRGHSAAPLNLRERVLTIDHDSRIPPRAPFERVLAVERSVVSDIQAFGYDAQETEQTAGPDSDQPAVWYLVRQDLYLNDLTTAFLVVHWKHTLELISLLDLIPGNGTRQITL